MTKLDAPNCKVRVPLPLSTYVPFRGNKIIKVQVRPHINVLYNKIYHIGLDYFVLSLCYIRNRKKRNQKVSNWTLLKKKLQNTWCDIHLYLPSPTYVYLSIGISRFSLHWLFILIYQNQFMFCSCWFCFWHNVTKEHFM